MNHELYRNLKYSGATLLILLLLSGADCGGLAPKCDNGPSGAVRTLAGTGASIVVDAFDNNTYALTIETPDPYLRWKNDLDFGNHTVTCFMDCWKSKYGDEAQPAVVWLGSTDPLCATISSLKYANGVITGVLKRPGGNYPTLAGSGDIVIDINKSCNLADPCLGLEGLSSTCFQPFMSLESNTGAVSVPGADLNFASLSGALLPNSDFSGTSLSNASFAGANLRGANFGGAVLVYTDFTGADMRGVKMGNARVYQAIAPNGTEVNSVNSLLRNLLAGSTTSSTSSSTTTTVAGSTTSTTSTM